MEVEAAVIRPRLAGLETLLWRRTGCRRSGEAAPPVLTPTPISKSSHPQVRNTLGDLVLGFQDESVVNFSESVSGSAGQDLQVSRRSGKREHRVHPPRLPSHTSSYTLLAPLLSPSNRWATPSSFFRLRSSGKIRVSFSSVSRAPRTRPARNRRVRWRVGCAGLGLTQELLPLGPPPQRRPQEVGRGVRELGRLSVAADGSLQHVVAAQLLSQVVLRLRTRYEDRT